MAYICPTCQSGSIVTRRKVFEGGRRLERTCLKGHRYSTFKPEIGRERVTANLKAVEPPTIDLDLIGQAGCNEYCPLWDYCNNEKPVFLPCEVYVYPDENPTALDTRELTHWPGLRMQANEGAGR